MSSLLDYVRYNVHFRYRTNESTNELVDMIVQDIVTTGGDTTLLLIMEHGGSLRDKVYETVLTLRQEKDNAQ